MKPLPPPLFVSFFHMFAMSITPIDSLPPSPPCT